TLNGPLTATLSRQGVTQLTPAALACAPGGSDSTASDAAPDPPPPKLGTSKLGIHEHAASVRPPASTAMPRYMLLIPHPLRPPGCIAPGLTIRRPLGAAIARPLRPRRLPPGSIRPVRPCPAPGPAGPRRLPQPSAKMQPNVPPIR